MGPASRGVYCAQDIWWGGIGNKKGTHYFLLQKSSKVGDRVTEVAGDDGKCSVDAGRVLNNIMNVHKVGHKAIS
jgi:hypothetical protein